MPSSIRSTKKSNFFLDSSGEEKLREFDSVKYFESGQEFFLTNFQIHPEYYTGSYDILPHYDFSSGNLYIVKDAFEIQKSGTEDKYVWLDNKYDNILNKTGISIGDFKKNLLNSSGFLYTGLNEIIFEDFSNIQNSGEQTGIIYSAEKFGNLPVDPYLGSGEHEGVSGSKFGTYQASLLNSGSEGLNDIFGVRYYRLLDNLFLGEFSGIFSSGDINYRSTGDYNTGSIYDSGTPDIVEPKNRLELWAGITYPTALYDLSGESDTNFVSGGNLPLTPETGFQESGMLPNEVLYYEPTQKIISEYTGSGMIYHPFPYFYSTLSGAPQNLTGSYTPSGSYILESDVLILPSGV